MISEYKYLILPANSKEINNDSILMESAVMENSVLI